MKVTEQKGETKVVIELSLKEASLLSGMLVSAFDFEALPFANDLFDALNTDGSEVLNIADPEFEYDGQFFQLQTKDE